MVGPQRNPRMYSEIVQGQLNLGPKGLVIEFLITVIVVERGTWLICKNRSSVLWKQTDYIYLLFTIVGGAAAVADLAISNWTKEIQQIEITSDEQFSRLKNYVDGGAHECHIRDFRRNSQQDAQQDDYDYGVIKPPHYSTHEHLWQLWQLPEGSDYQWGYAKLSESECLFIQLVSNTMKSDPLKKVPVKSLYNVIGDSMKFGLDLMNLARSGTSAAILVEIVEINNYSDRAEELEKTIASLNFFSILKNLSPVLLGLGVGVRLARTHFDVKTEQEKQRRDASTGIRGLAIATTNDATTVGEAQD
jgi:hypothetical protein